MEEAFPPSTQLDPQEPFAAITIRWSYSKTDEYLVTNEHRTAPCPGFSPSWAACCVVGTGETRVGTEEVVGNAS